MLALRPLGYSNLKSKKLNSAPLRRSTTIVWNGGRIANRHHPDAGVSDCSNRRFAATTGSLYSHLTLLHAGLMSLFRGFVGGLLRGKRGSLTRTSKTTRARRRLSDEINLQVGNRDHRIIKRGGNVGNAHRHILLLFLTENLLLASSFCHIFVSTIVSCQWLVVIRTQESRDPGPRQST